MAFKRISALKSAVTLRGVAILALQVGLVLLLAGAGWMIYKRLPASGSDVSDQRTTTLQIVLQQTPESAGSLDVAVSLFPIDIVAVKHEYFTEPKPGKRYEDFLKERMKGRPPIITRLDKQGHGTVMLSPGSWLLRAILSGEEQLEWQLPVTVGGARQTVELTPQNVYTRSKTF